MATHSSVLAWRIPGTGEPGGLLSLGLHRVRHDWGDLAVAVHNNTGILQPEVGGGWRDLRNTVENSLNCHEFLLESGLGQGGWWGHRNKWGTIQFSRSVVSESLQPHGLQHARLSYHQLLDLAQSQVWVGDAIQPSHPLASPSPPSFNLSQHQGLFKWVSFLHQVAKILEFQLQHQSFQWIFRTDFL